MVNRIGKLLWEKYDGLDNRRRFALFIFFIGIPYFLLTIDSPMVGAFFIVLLILWAIISLVKFK